MWSLIKSNQVGKKLNKEEELVNKLNKEEGIETPIEQYTPIQVLSLKVSYLLNTSKIINWMTLFEILKV